MGGTLKFTPYAPDISRALFARALFLQIGHLFSFLYYVASYQISRYLGVGACEQIK
jgi:hypothetical protein